MSGATGILASPSRIAAGGYVVPDPGPPGVATIVRSLGIVDRAEYVDVGEVDIFFRLTNGFDVNRPPILLLTLISSTFGQIGATFLPPGLPPAPQVIQGFRVFIGDAAGSPADTPFSFLVLSTERSGAQPLPAPGT